MTPQIKSALTWDEPHHSDLIQQWRVQHTIGFLKEYAVRSNCERNQATRLLRRAASLSPPSFLRVFKAPETFWRTLRCAKGDKRGYLNFLERSIEVEFFLAGQQYHLARSAWSALGDVRVSSSMLWSETSYSDTRHSELNLVIDAYSPYARRPFIIRRHSPISVSKPGLFLDNELLLIHRKISEALDAIAAISERLSDFVNQNVNVIVPYRDSVNPRYFSASSNRFIGQAMLINPHLQDVSMPFLVNALLHESVHSYLYAIELRYPLLREQAKQSDLIVSPWTGAKLSLHSYVHACFVWFALLRFWDSESARCYFGSSSEAYTSAARAGFSKNEFTKRLMPFAFSLAAGTMEQITRLSGECHD